MARNRRARPQAESLRLFVAVDMPEEVARALEDSVRPWRERLESGRWVPRENWHVTLKFLGRTWPRLLPLVEAACREVAGGVAPFEVALSGLGVFPGPGRARVLWAGLDDPDGRLMGLAAGLDGSLVRDFPPEKRAFTPHLTVARFNPPIPMRDHAEELAAMAIEASPFVVDRLVLYRSHLSPRGARYEGLEDFPFGGADR
ncbi:MAG TPA: RNA 2',3'-cyclic phosphodiesterase [Actinomycetota bacterium]|nr:RNA 2',3'-cyclic phosphodiesterase [Actinomycetota bacterium]